MTTSPITIQVETEAAKAFANASPEARQKFQLLLSLCLQEITAPQGKTLNKVMDEIGTRAENRGLTHGVLDRLLGDE